jgi:succinyl-CoA synthetase beta subunit
VVRLDGTNAVEGRALLEAAARPEITVEQTMLDAAQTAVRLAGEAR